MIHPIKKSTNKIGKKYRSGLKIEKENQQNQDQTSTAKSNMKKLFERPITLKLGFAIFYKIYIFHQMIDLQNL